MSTVCFIAPFIILHKLKREYHIIEDYNVCLDDSLTLLEKPETKTKSLYFMYRIMYNDFCGYQTITTTIATTVHNVKVSLFIHTIMESAL